MSSHLQQFNAIQSMLAAGHRSVHLEQHSLLLIGGVGGFIAAATEYLITAAHFPDLTHRAVALLLWLTFWLGGMAWLDQRLTRRARARRDETMPFAQAQITRAWWMLLSMGTLGSFAMFFYGGGGMIYAQWIVLLGLGIYLFGLFSRRLIEWIGLATILLGVISLAAGLPYGVAHWLTASCFAIGMPLAGWLNTRVQRDGLAQVASALFAWLLLVVLPPLVLSRALPTTPPNTSTDHILRLAAGSRVPLHVDLDSSILNIKPQAGLEMTLLQPLEVVLQDSMPDGRYRIGNGDWHEIHEGVLQLRIDRLTPQLADGQPTVRAHASFAGPNTEGNQP